MKIIFAGTPDFSVPSLNALLEHHHEIKLVLTQPDRPAGRGRKMQWSPVKEVAIKHGLNVLQPITLKNEDTQLFLKEQKADLMVVVAYGLLLPPAVLTIPTKGCINVHASLLPRWRGAAPIPYAILSGDQETGVTIMQMDRGLDTGDILMKESCPIHPTDTTHTLHDRLSKLGATLLIKTLFDLEKGKIQAKKQDEQHATHAGKITKEQACLDWRTTATELERKVRAFNPWPIAHFQLNGEIIRVWKAEAIPAKPTAPPGTLISVTPEHCYIACEEGLFSPQILQFSGRNPIDWNSVYNSRRHLFMQGTTLSCPT